MIIRKDFFGKQKVIEPHVTKLTHKNFPVKIIACPCLLSLACVYLQYKYFLCCRYEKGTSYCRLDFVPHKSICVL